MMRKQLLQTTAAFVIGAVLFNASPAFADLPTVDVLVSGAINMMETAVTNTITNMATSIVGSVTKMETSVSDLLTKGFTQNANYAKAQVGAQQQITDASNTVNARFARDMRNAQIRDEHVANPQFCLSADAGQTPIAASIASNNVVRAIQDISDRRGEAVPGTPASKGQAQAVQAINKLHMGRYCSDDESAAGLCTKSALANADQHATNLFGSGTYDGQDAVNAANDFKTNLIQPVSPAALRADQLTSITGQDAWARRRSYNARMSLASSVISYAIAVQTPSVPLTTQQQQQLTNQGLPAQTTGSWLTAVSLEVNRRLSDAGWHADLQRMPPASVLREIATELALNNYMNMQNYRLGLYQSSLSAAQVAQAEEQNFQTAVPLPTPNMVAN